jgi:Opacity protein and related surface antigens
MPGCMASSTRRTFSAVVQRRRRCTEVITSTRGEGENGSEVIVIIIGVCLCLIGYAACPVKTGCTPLRGTKVQPGLDPYGFPYDGYGKVRGGWYGAISARLGYALDRTLIYVKGGAVYSGAKLGFLDTCTEDPCGNTTISISKKVEWGYLLGAGVEHAWTDNLTAKIEYAYMDFGRSTIHGLGYVGGWNAVPFNIRSDLSVHSVRLGRVDGFGQDEACDERDEGSKVSLCLLAA